MWLFVFSSQKSHLVCRWKPFVLRALFVEFGVVELFDTLFIRPMLIYYIPIWVGDLSWGVIIAKFAADITFYIPAILSYELSKKKLRDFE